MQLDERLKKIASGVSVADAIESYLGGLGEPVEEEDRATRKRTELLSIVEIMYLMAAVDGEVSDDEIQELHASVMALEDLEAIEGGIELEAVMKDFGARLKEEGWRSCLQRAASNVRTPEARAFAFQLAAGVAFVDDFVAHAEAAAIDALANALDLPKDESQQLLQDVHASLFGYEE